MPAPSTAARKTGIDPYRRKLYGKIEVAKKQLGLDDDTYRDILQQRFGKRSRKQLGNRQLVELIEHFKAQGFRPAPPKGKRRPPVRVPEMAGKIRALWRAAWDLGVVKDPDERALAAFVKRMTGLDAPAWMDGDGAYRVIEGLKAWLAREAGVDWSPVRIGHNGREAITADRPRQRVIEAQWRRLGKLGVLRIPKPEALDEWLTGKVSPHRTALGLLEDGQLDNAQARLGQWLRRELAKGGRE